MHFNAKIALNLTHNRPSMHNCESFFTYQKFYLTNFPLCTRKTAISPSTQNAVSNIASVCQRHNNKSKLLEGFSSIETKAWKGFFNLSSARDCAPSDLCAYGSIDEDGVKKPFSIAIAPSTSAQISNSSANREIIGMSTKCHQGFFFRGERRSALKNAIHKNFPPQSILIYEYWLRINVISRSLWRKSAAPHLHSSFFVPANLSCSQFIIYSFHFILFYFYCSPHKKKSWRRIEAREKNMILQFIGW